MNNLKTVKIISISNAHQWDNQVICIGALLDIMTALQTSKYHHTIKWFYTDQPKQINITFI